METKKKLTKSELKEMVRQELQSVLAERKKVKNEKELKEGIDIPATLDMIQDLFRSAEAGVAIPVVVVAALAKLTKNIPGLKQALDKSTGGAPTSVSTTGKGGGMGQNA